MYSGSGGPLPEFDCGPSSGPQSSDNAPAGQVDGVFEEDWTSSAQLDLEPTTLDHSFYHNSLPQQPQGIAEASEIINTQSATTFPCDKCSQSFSKRHLLNKHMKKHSPPFQCDKCTHAFVYKKDLKRHCSSKHPETAGELTRLFCPFSGCKFSAEKSSGSTRRDNLERHIQTQHGR